MIEYLSTYIQSHWQQIVSWSVYAGRAAIGSVLMGLTIASFYFIFFIIRILKMEKGSREYYQFRQHIMVQSLVRYSITIGCIFTIDALIFAYFEWGPHSMVLGIAVSCIVITINKFRGYMDKNKVKKT